MILGIETSCDETSVALLERDGTVRVNLIASQIERHRPFGGVVPEIASREHLQHLFPLVSRALDEGPRWASRLSSSHMAAAYANVYREAAERARAEPGKRGKVVLQILP